MLACIGWTLRQFKQRYKKTKLSTFTFCFSNTSWNACTLQWHKSTDCCYSFKFTSSNFMDQHKSTIHALLRLFMSHKPKLRVLLVHVSKLSVTSHEKHNSQLTVSFHPRWHKLKAFGTTEHSTKSRCSPSDATAVFITAACHRELHYTNTLVHLFNYS
jgi:hypothetical protein